MTTVSIVTGGQYGSEAKGHVAARLFLSTPDQNRLPVIRVGGPNAGHSVYGVDGQIWPFRTIPVSAVLNSMSPLVIGPGSEIDLDVIADEIYRVQQAGINMIGRVIVDEQATILTAANKHQEDRLGMHQRLGSTAKGIGAARADRLMRTAPIASDYRQRLETMGCDVMSTEDWMHHVLPGAPRIIIEGTQGVGLGLHYGHYPYCTGGDTRAIDFYAQSGLPLSPHLQIEPWLVFRTHPIRVAGNSGPMYDETDWETLSAETGGYIQPEQTTVTKETRRVGRWDPVLFHRSLAAHGGVSNRNLRIALTFADYVDPTLAGVSDPHKIVRSVPLRAFHVAHLNGMPLDMVTTGPKTGAML